MDPDAAEFLERSAHKRRVQNLVIGTVLTVVTAAGAIGLILGAIALNEIQATSDYLRECTTPSTDTEFHRCYEDGQRRTAEAIEALIDSQEFYSERQLCLLAFPIEKRDAEIQDRCEAEAQRIVDEGGAR